jgi:hypothetical protein
MQKRLERPSVAPDSLPGRHVDEAGFEVDLVP